MGWLIAICAIVGTLSFFASLVIGVLFGHTVQILSMPLFLVSGFASGNLASRLANR